MATPEQEREANDETIRRIDDYLKRTPPKPKATMHCMTDKQIDHLLKDVEILREQLKLAYNEIGALKIELRVYREREKRDWRKATSLRW